MIAIKVLIFIELMFPPPSLSVDEEWNRTVTVLTSLRNEFPSLLQKYSSKFHKTTQDALNKVFCNYSSYRKVSLIEDVAIHGQSCQFYIISR